MQQVFPELNCQCRRTGLYHLSEEPREWHSRTLHHIQASRRVRRTAQTKSISPTFIHALQPRSLRSAKLCFHWLSSSRVKLKKLCPIFDVSMGARMGAPSATRSAAKRHAFSLVPPQGLTLSHMREDRCKCVSACF
jgi:hypothetical protein